MVRLPARLIPFTLLTALPAQDQRLTGFQTGADDYLTKPFDSRALLVRVQLYRKLAGLTGVAASDFIRFMRLKRAAQFPEGRTGSVSEIAYSIGFNSLPYFAKCFREPLGILPTQYKGRLASPA